MFVPDATDIRESHANISRKLMSLQIAINERRHQLQTVEGFLNSEESGSTNRRLRSARVKPPRYVSALQGTLQRDIHTLRSEYERGRQTDAYPGREARQLGRLVNNIEKRFDDIVQSLYIPADVIRDAAKRESHVTVSTASAEEQEGEASRSDSCGRRSVVLPDIYPTPAPRDSAPPSASVRSVTFSCPSVLEGNTQCSDAPGSDACADLATDSSVNNQPDSSDHKHTNIDVIEEEDPDDHVTPTIRVDPTLAFSRGYTMLNKYPLRTGGGGGLVSDSTRRSSITQRRSTIGYPYGSSFPVLPPLPAVRRQRVVPIAMTLTGEQIRPSLGRSKTMLANNKVAREKTWFY